MFGKLPENKKQLIYRHLHAMGIFCANKITSRFSELVDGLPLPSPSPIGKLHKVYRNSRSIAGMISHAYYTRRFTEIVGETSALDLGGVIRNFACRNSNAVKLGYVKF